MIWLGVIIAVLIVIMLVIKTMNTGHLRKLQRSRPALSKEEYVQQLNEKGHDEEIVSALYDTIKFYLPRWFMPYPGDNLIKTYSIAGGDIHTFMQELLQANDHKLPPDEVMQDIYKKHNEQVTVEYLLEIIENSRPNEQ